MSHRLSRTLVGLAALLLLALVAYAAWQFMPSDVSEPDPTSFASEYGLVLQDYNGESVNLSRYKKEFLVVYMWASWCPYCAAELENLAQLKQSYGDSVQIIAVNRAEPAAVAKSYTETLATQGIPLLLDPTDSLYKEIGGYAMPETVFIRPDGEVLFHQRGPIQLAEVEAKIQELLALTD